MADPGDKQRGASLWVVKTPEGEEQSFKTLDEMKVALESGRLSDAPRDRSSAKEVPPPPDGTSEASPRRGHEDEEETIPLSLSSSVIEDIVSKREPAFERETDPVPLSLRDVEVQSAPVILHPKSMPPPLPAKQEGAGKKDTLVKRPASLFGGDDDAEPDTLRFPGRPKQKPNPRVPDVAITDDAPPSAEPFALRPHRSTVATVPPMARRKQRVPWIPIVLTVAVGIGALELLTRPKPQPTDPVPAELTTQPKVDVPPQILTAPEPSAALAAPPSASTSVPTSTPTPTSNPTPNPKDAISVPGDSTALLDAAAAAQQKGDFSLAQKLYRALLDREPHSVDALSGLADAARALGNRPEAIANYERALARSPGFYPSLLGLADTLWDNGDQGEARMRYAEILERYPSRDVPGRVRQRASP